jgi:galactose mutarotase-like enzyme
MNITLTSASASCAIRSLGAELSSLRRLDTGIEYLWNGDPAYWAGTAPVLFPIVCALNGGTLRHQGQSYPMGNHGFVRKDEFALVETTETKAVFRHTWSEATLAMYPFRYELTITYTLTGSRLAVHYHVANLGTEVMPFQIGTHPGFRCPLTAGEAFEQSYLEFEKDEVFVRHFLGSANTLIAGKTQTLPPGRTLALTRGLFADGALVFKSVASRKVTLKSRASPRSVVLTWDNLPALGIWQAQGAPFVCLEPWHGLADQDDFTGEFSQKELIVQLAPSATWECWHAIEVL